MVQGPIAAPAEAPNVTSARRRFPSSGVYTSFVNAQNCAMIITLKMPTQMKKGTPTGTPALERK